MTAMKITTVITIAFIKRWSQTAWLDAHTPSSQQFPLVQSCLRTRVSLSSGSLQ
jgi:hypothetical protein